MAAWCAEGKAAILPAFAGDLAMLTWSEYGKILVAILVILDPPIVIPMFLHATADETPSRRRRTARVTAATVVLILCLSVLVGQWLLGWLGIRVSAFRVGGGILLMLMAISMMQARVSPTLQTPEEALEAQEKEAVAVVPLAMPLLAGPGAISTMIIYSHKAAGWEHKAVLCGIVALSGLVCWLALELASAIEPWLGRTGLNVMTRIMGLLLISTAVEFIAIGLQDLFPVLR